MLYIEVASGGRGFLEELYNTEFNNCRFINEKQMTEKTEKNHKILRSIFYSKLFDMIGYIYINKIETSKNALITYNRFLKTNKPYYIICENPTALFHYKLNRNNGIYAKKEIKKRIDDENLKAIICISKACYNTFQEVLGIQTNKLVQIYPLIKDQRLTLKKSSEDKQLTCLYISSNFELKSGLELLEVSEKIQNVNFIFVTREKTISKEILNRIKKASNIQLIEFNLNKKELNSLYLMSDILIHATRQDSFGLVVLEAVKMGLPVLATNMYAIKEMVIDNYNGFLVTPKYQFFDDNDIPNASVWNHRKSTINKTFVDNNIVNFLETKINFYDKNRDKLEEMSKNSFELSQKEFSENSIKGKWDDLFHRTLR